MSYRQFKLLNKNGAEYNLTFPPAWLYEPSGLGWGIETEYFDVGNAYIKGDSTFMHPSPSGTIIFSGYQEYDRFLRFIQIGGTVLGYKPLDDWMYLDCDVSIEKSEIDHEVNRLMCSVSFNGLSHWYTAETAYYAQKSTPFSSKRYTYKYSNDMPNGNYGYTYVSDAGAVDIANGSLESPMKITIFGVAVNPKYELYKDGHLISTGKFNYTVPSGKKLVINNRPNEMESALYNTDNSGRVNLYTFSDFTTERFFYLPAGNSQMYFTDDNGVLTNCVVEVFKRV